MKRTSRGITASVLLVTGVLACHASLAQSSASIADRLTRLERVVNSETLVDLLQRVQRLQSEVEELRGEIEEQNHALSQLKARQRELYLDVDRRLGVVESRGAPAPVPEPPLAGEPDAPTASGAAAGASPPPTITGIDPIKEQDSYQTAFNLLKAGRYDEAAGAFNEFLARYPSSKYSDNAQYWLGEAYYVTRRFDPAMQEFKRLIQTHPNSPKLTHALLKVGYIYDEKGMKTEAEQALSDLVTRYPQSTAARLANERLQRMRGQSN